MAIPKELSVSRLWQIVREARQDSQRVSVNASLNTVLPPPAPPTPVEMNTSIETETRSVGELEESEDTMRQAILEIRDHLIKQESSGETYQETMSLSSTMTEMDIRHPVTNDRSELIEIGLLNYGPHTADIWLNYPGGAKITLTKGESISMEFYRAKRRVGVLLGRTETETDNTAKIRVVGRLV